MGDVPHDDHLDPRAGAAIGGLIALGLGLALVPLRSHLANTSVALLLVLPVLVGALIGGMAGGGLSAVCATLSFDFFHTRPYGSLSVSSGQDVETALVLLAVALVLGGVAARARGAHRVADAGRTEVRRIHRVSELVAGGAAIDDVVRSATAEIAALLPVDSCTYEPAGTTGDGAATRTPAARYPALGCNGVIEGAPLTFLERDFALPDEGLQIPVRGLGRRWGRLVLRTAHPRRGASLESRIGAVAIADQLGVAIAAAALHHHQGEEGTCSHRSN